MKLIWGVIFFILSAKSLCCEVSNPLQSSDVNALIARTNRVILAEVIRAELSKDGQNVTYSFHAEENIKGSAGEFFTIEGSTLSVSGMKNFNDHNDNEFWVSFGGRQSARSDCKIHPSFAVGGIYLVFVDEPYHNKSFEQIIKTHGAAGIKDKWLQYVEDFVKKNKATEKN